MKLLRVWKNLEFSKKLLVYTEFLLTYVCILTTVAVFKGDSSALTALIPASFALATISFSFYFWKAKCENIKKWSKGVSFSEMEKIIKIYRELGRGAENE